jgi:hypothetical protein
VHRFAALALVALALPVPAHAVIYIGNPTLGFRVDRPANDYVDGSVYLIGVRVHYCGGGYDDYAVGQTIDPVAGYTVTVSGGNLCGATWAWGSTMSIEGPAYDLEAYDDTTFFAIDGDIDPVALEDWDVVSGTYSGLGPYGVLSIH